MQSFLVKFHNAPELICKLNDTPLAKRYYELVRQQYLADPNPIYRDQQKYTMDRFGELVDIAQNVLGWDWHRTNYDLPTTTHLHKFIEEYLARGFENIPEEHDTVLHELHFALHAIESGSKRDNWLQIEWYNNSGFAIKPEEFPAKVRIEFGDLRLQNPYVGHHPLYMFQQQDSINVMQTCRFHDFCKPGINIVIDPHKNQEPFDTETYLTWWQANGSELIATHGIERLLQFTGHPIVGRVVNLAALQQVVDTPILELEYLKF